jgi:hypothetical protein
VPFKKYFPDFSSAFSPLLGSCFVLESVEKHVNISSPKKIIGVVIHIRVYKSTNCVTIYFDSDGRAILNLQFSRWKKVCQKVCQLLYRYAGVLAFILLFDSKWS